MVRYRCLTCDFETDDEDEAQNHAEPDGVMETERVAVVADDPDTYRERTELGVAPGDIILVSDPEGDYYAQIRHCRVEPDNEMWFPVANTPDKPMVQIDGSLEAETILAREELGSVLPNLS